MEGVPVSSICDHLGIAPTLFEAMGYITPRDVLEGRDKEIFAARDRKLAEARERRKQIRQTQHEQREARAESSRSAIDFAAANHLSIYDAAVDLCQRLNIAVPLLAPPSTPNRQGKP